MAQTKQDLEELLAEVDTFMGSKLYKHFQFTLQTDLDAKVASLAHGAPASVEDILAKQKLHGEKELVEAQLQIFEEFRAVLEEKLANLV